MRRAIIAILLAGLGLFVVPQAAPAVGRGAPAPGVRAAACSGGDRHPGCSGTGGGYTRHPYQGSGGSQGGASQGGASQGGRNQAGASQGGGNQASGGSKSGASQAGASQGRNGSAEAGQSGGCHGRACGAGGSQPGGSESAGGYCSTHPCKSNPGSTNSGGNNSGKPSSGGYCATHSCNSNPGKGGGYCSTHTCGGKGPGGGGWNHHNPCRHGDCGHYTPCRYRHCRPYWHHRAPEYCDYYDCGEYRDSLAYEARMTGDQEVPDRGPDGASGLAGVDIDVRAGQLCFNLTYDGIDPPDAAYIQAGRLGEVGDVVVDLDPADNGDQACVPVDRDLLRAIEADPAGYFVNLHADGYRTGAIRGQLHPVE